MRRIAAKAGFMTAIAVKVWAEAGISGSLGAANLVFRINPQESQLKNKRSLDSLS